MGSTQYDNIVSAYNDLYDDVQNLLCAQLEESNLHHALKDFVKNGRVLELACGSGHYSRKMLEWGASSVLGVDISAGMVEDAEARAKALNISSDQLRYHVADIGNGLDLTSLGGPWDLVVATWLLNYAPSAKDMEGMWRTVFKNLHPGGLFFGITINPPLGNMEEIERAHNHEWAKYGTSGHVKHEVQDGFAVHTVLGMPGSTKTVAFDNYFLRSEAFESSAKSAGLGGASGGALEWLPFVLSDKLRDSYPGGFWNGAVLNPHFRVCRIER